LTTGVCVFAILLLLEWVRSPMLGILTDLVSKVKAFVVPFWIPFDLGGPAPTKVRPSIPNFSA